MDMDNGKKCKFAVCTVFMESWARGTVGCSGFGFYVKKGECWPGNDCQI